MIPYGRHDITEDDIRAVVDVLRSDFLTQGPAVPAFEAAVAAWCGAGHAVAVNSATSALHVACLALDIGPGDRVWTVPNTFVASANCALYCGAGVDFVDIDPGTWNISIQLLSRKLERAAREDCLPKLLIPVHFAGQPTAQKQIHELSRRFGFRIVEDASHAIGALGHGERVGSCRWSDITVFSFHPVKIVTTGEGGMALTNDPMLAEKMALLRSHGITRDSGRLRLPSPGAWYYEQQVLGFNYRMTDLQAALGLSQFARLEDYVDRRNVLADRYRESLGGLPLACQNIETGNRSAYHLFVIRLTGAVVARHAEIFAALRKQGIGVNLHYMPVHLQPYYRDLGFSQGYCPEAEQYAREAISLPLYPTMGETALQAVVDILRDLLA